jgi:hypothetical protein
MLEQNINLINLPEEKYYKTIFGSLIEVLKKELIIFYDLKKAMLNEKKILIKPSLNELNHSNAIKENIILKARMLEEVRLNILKKIAHNLDINVSEIKLKNLADYAGNEQSKEIKIITEEMSMISADISALNESNKDLLDVSLACVKNSLDFITSMLSSEAVYMKTGQIKTRPDNGKFIHTEG